MTNHYKDSSYRNDAEIITALLKQLSERANEVDTWQDTARILDHEITELKKLIAFVGQHFNTLVEAVDSYTGNDSPRACPDCYEALRAISIALEN